MPSLCDNLHLTDAGTQQVSALRGIALQKSETAGQQISRQKSKQATIADRCGVRLVTEVASEFITPRLQLEKFAINGAKRLLQHNLPEADFNPPTIRACLLVGHDYARIVSPHR